MPNNYQRQFNESQNIIIGQDHGSELTISIDDDKQYLPQPLKISREIIISSGDEELKNNNSVESFQNINNKFRPTIVKLDSLYDDNVPFQNHTNTYYTQDITDDGYNNSNNQIPYGDTQLPKIIVRNGDNDDDHHFTPALIFFVAGFFIFCFWLLNIKHLKSRNKSARTISNISIILFLITSLLILILILAQATSNGFLLLK